MIPIAPSQNSFSTGETRRSATCRTMFAWLLVPGFCAWLVLAGAQAADTKARPADRKPPSDAGDSSVAGQLKDAFDRGYIVGPKRLNEAQKHLAQARRSAPDDPRIDFALGLMLVKQGQMKPALAQFDAAVERDGAAYWPAWQVAIWAHLSEKQYEAGLKRLDEFAAIVQKAEKPDEVSEIQREAARWVGQLLEAVVHVPESRKYDDLLAEHQIKVLDTLGDELSTALEEGREVIRARQFTLDQAAGAARDTAARKKGLRDQGKTEKIEKDIDGASQEKDKAKKSEEEWKKWLDDMLAASDKQLGQLEKDYTFLDQRAQSLMQSYTLAGTQLTALNLSVNPATLKNLTPMQANNLQQQMIDIQNQMAQYQTDYNATVGRMSDVSQRGNLAIQQRADGIKRYETETGQLVKKKSDLDKWSNRLKNEKKKLVSQKATGKAARKAPVDKAKLTLKSVLPLNLERERDQLLASFAPPVAPPSAPPAKDDQSQENSGKGNAAGK